MISVDQSNRWLFSAYYGGACIAVHAIALDGTLSEAPVAHVRTATGCHWAGTDPANRHCISPCIARSDGSGSFNNGDEMHCMTFHCYTQRISSCLNTYTYRYQHHCEPAGKGRGWGGGGVHRTVTVTSTLQLIGNRVFVHRFDARTGALTSASEIKPPQPPASGGGEECDGRNRFGNLNEHGPRHVAFHPTINAPQLMYTSDEQANTVSTWTLTSDARLEHWHSAEMLPLNFSWPNKRADNFGSMAAEIVVHPSGRCLFASNRHIGSCRPDDPSWTPSNAVAQTVSCFEIGKATGRLLPESEAHQLVLPHAPESLALDEGGGLLFAAGMDSTGHGQLSVCVLPADDPGRPRHVQTLALGPGCMPGMIRAIELPHTAVVARL